MLFCFLVFMKYMIINDFEFLVLDSKLNCKWFIFYYEVYVCILENSIFNVRNIFFDIEVFEMIVFI